jgi:hypothetical protein
MTCKYVPFFSDEFKRALGVHQKIDRRLVHVKDVTLVTIAAEDNLPHESHVIENFALDFGRRALRLVRAHLIGHRMGIAESLHSAALRYEAHLAEFGQDIRHP